ncbi:hypothetical protein CBS14141_004116 [Malassezia furfur]|nr:hypothetical protein CBS14141_004116 [Malassezia furfur]
MRLPALLCAAAAVLGFAPAALAAAGDEAPELNVITTFPDNPFSLVQNGRPNRVVFSFSHPPGADRALVLEEITGAFLNPAKRDGQRGRVLRNMTTTHLKAVPIASAAAHPVQVPFDFYPEFKPQSLDVEFRVKVLDQGNTRRYNLPVYRGTVVVEEPAPSFFDVQLLSVYAVMATALAGVAYFVYTQYLAAYVRPKAPAKRTQPTQPAKPAAANHEEWLPQQPTVRTRRQAAAAASRRK